MPITVIAWLILCLIWGSTWLVIKVGLNDLPPVGFAAARFILATVILFAILRARKIPLPSTAAQWRLLALTGALQFSINYSLIFWGEQYITSGLAAVLQATISIFGLVLAWIHLPSERITKTKIVSVCLGIAGVAVIFRDQLQLQDMMSFYASVAVVIAAYAATQSAILVKAKGDGLHPVTVLFGQMVCGLPPIIAYSLSVEGNPLNYHWTWHAVVAVLYLALIGTIAAFWLFYWLLEKMESTIVMMVSVVTPVIAVILGWLILDERLPPQIMAGGLLIIASIALIVFWRKAKA